MKIQRLFFCLLLWLVATVMAQAQTAPTILQGDFGTQPRGVLEFWLEATGGQAPYRFSFTPNAPQSPGFQVFNRSGAGSLPGWFPPNITAGLLGVAAAPATYTFSVRVTGSDNVFSDKIITFQVPDVIITTGGLRDTSVGENYSFQLEGAGAAPPYSFALSPFSAQLPPGISLNPSGLIAGTPTTAGGFGFSVRITDSSVPAQFADVFQFLNISPLRFDSPRVLPAGLVNTAYSQTLQVSGGTAPYTWSVDLNQSLPNGLTLSPGGTISGTPTFQTNWGVTVVASDSAGNSISRRIVIDIRGNSPSPIQFNASLNLGEFTLGNYTNIWLGVSGGILPYTYSVEPGSTLPAGMRLVSGEALAIWAEPIFNYLDGRPLNSGNYSFTLRVTDSVGNSAVREFTLRTSPLYLENIWLPLQGMPDAIVGQPFSTQFLTLGGAPPYTWSPVDLLPSGLALNASTGILSGTPTDTGHYYYRVRATDAANNSLAQLAHFFATSGTGVTLAINEGPDLGTRSAGSFTQFLSGSGSPLANPNYAFSLDAGSSLPAGLALLTGDSLPNVGLGSNVTAVVSGLLTSPGVYQFRLRVTDAAGNFGVRTMTVRISPIRITTFSLLNGSTAASYSQQLSAQGGAPPYTWTLSSGALPSGLTLSPTGSISATPTASGSYNFSVLATDTAGNTATQFYSVVISSLNITTDGLLPSATINQPYSVTLNAVGPGAPYVWTSNSVPSGLTLNSGTGVLAGTPTFGGTWNFDVTVGNAAATEFFTKRFSLNSIQPSQASLVSVSNIFSSDFSVGQVLSTTLFAFGGRPPYAWSLQSGSLPPGLSFLSGTSLPAFATPGSTVLSGILTTPGTYTFTLRATDTAGTFGSRSMTLKVSPLALASSSLRRARLGESFAQQLVAVGGTPPYTFSQFAFDPINTGALPPGLSLSPSGLVSGIPTNTGNHTLGIRVTDSAGSTLSLLLGFGVDSPTGVFLDIFASGLQDAPVGIFRQLNFFTSGGTAPYTVALEFGSTLPPGLSMQPPNSNGSVIISGIPTTAGNYAFTFRATDSFGNIAVRTFTLLVTPLNITNSFPAGRIGIPYSGALTVVNGTPPYTFSLPPFVGNALPGGLTLSSTGIISGTPTDAGSVGFTVRVQDANGFTLTRPTGVTIYPTAQFPLIAPTVTFGLPQASFGSSYTFELNTIVPLGSPPYNWALASGSTLPPGIGLTPGSGAVSAFLNGTPTALGNFSFSLVVTDSAGQSQTVAFRLFVSQISLAPAALSVAVKNSPYSQVLTASGGAAPYTFALTSTSSLPLGLTFDSSGMITGAPTVEGVFSVGVSVTDSGLATLLRFYRFTVLAPGTPVMNLVAAPATISLNYVQGSPAPVPVPLSVGSTSGAPAYTVNTSGGTWLSASPSSGTTPDTVLVTFNTAGLAPGTYNGVVTVSSAAAANSPQLVPVTLTISAPVPCSFSLSPGSATVGASGGSGSFDVTTPATCNWSAQSGVPWITFSKAASGTGNGSVSYSVAANGSSSSRTGTVNVAGQIFSVTQFGTAAAYSISPTSAAAPAAGGTANIVLTTSTSGDAWTATTSDGWISFTGPASGTGGATIQISVAVNTAPASRTGTVSIQGQTFTVNQTGAGCSFGLSPVLSAFAWTGGSVSVSVTAGGSCTWEVANLPSWITVTSGSSGIGNGVATLTVDANSSTQAREATVQIGGQSFLISQTGVPCSFSLSANNPVQPAAGGTSNVTITASGSGCDWVAYSNADWILMSQQSGSGNGPVTLTVAANPSAAARSGTVTIAGQNLTVTQSGTVCSYSLQSPGAVVEAGTGSASVGVLAASGCAWTASSNASWITIVSGASGSGNSQALFSIEGNSTGAERSGTLTVAGQTFSVTQKPASCAYVLSSASISVSEAGGSGSFTYASSASSCPAVVASYASWITVTSHNYTGNTGTVNFSVSQNITGSPRAGQILVGDEPFTVNQAPAVCLYTLTPPPSATFTRFGGTGTAGFSLTSGTATPCVPIVGTIPGFDTGLSLGSLTSSGSNYLQNYSVSPYQTFILWIRTMLINIGGQTYTVKQNSF